MLKPFLGACACAFLLAATASAQVQQAPPGVQITPPRLPPNTPTPPIVTACAPDLAVVSVTLTKGGLGQLSVDAEARNIGRGTWQGLPAGHALSWSLNNRASGRRHSRQIVLPESIAEGAVAGTVSSGVINNAYSAVAPQTSVVVIVAHHPDYRNDQYPCNDDPNYENDLFSLSVEQVRAFVRSTARTQTFRR